MPRRIAIEIADDTFFAGLADTPIADAVWDALPLEARFNAWGDEIYFDTGVAIEPGEMQETVELGDVGYWLPGRALCLYYGPTPMSGPGEIRPASPVAVVGKLEGDPSRLRRVSGRSVRVTRRS